MKNKRVVIRNHSAEANLFARRAFIALIGMFILLLVLFNNIYSLQVSSFKKYQTRSNSNRIKLLPVAPNRGLIYDRNGVLLAENKPVYSLEIIPEQVSNLKETISELSSLLEISTDRQAKFFKNLKRNRRFKPVELKSRLSEQQVALFSVNQHKYPGVVINARLKRYYPFADLTTHTLGYVARINRKDVQKLAMQNKSENYAATRDIGKLGLEKYYEEILHGKIGHQEVEVNSQGRIIRTLSFSPPTPGKDLTLTLDIELQMIAKRAMQGRRGAVVAIDPRTGGVLALYSNPSYDGNLFVHGISSKKYKKILSSKDRPLVNRAVQGYPPASTIKPFMAVLGLEKGVVTPHTKVYDPGWYKIKGVKRKYRDWLSYGHGKVDLTKAIEQSCNVYFYDLALKLRITNISDWMEKFGFGDHTGIDLLEESSGILPSRQWKRARRNKPWYTGETLMVGIGQSYWSVTPLQLAQAVTILVNKGKINIPHLLAKTTELAHTNATDENTQPITTTINEQILYEEKAPIVIKNPINWDIVLNAMHNTVQKPRATGHPGFVNTHYDAAGKSGTAQVAKKAQDTKYDAAKVKENKRNNAMFIAYAPFKAPEIVVAVAIENVFKGGGGTNAGPVARQIMDQYFGKRTFSSPTLPLPKGVK
ncbi:MAG: penicillin-binding protein 2 [Gammaproteobacteria bacterium]|nr:MAG: penicillin-binding protein 2 [Gammaproteobacteria bacterium]